MQDSQKGFIVAVIITIILAGGGILIYQQNIGPHTEDSLMINEVRKTADNIGEDGNNIDKNTTAIDHDGDCPAITEPDASTCPNGNIEAQLSGNCIVGYKCKEISHEPEKCNDICKTLGSDSGKCVEKNADNINQSFTNKPGSDCSSGQGCVCKFTGDTSCNENNDCIDPGCNVCVNAKWSASNQCASMSPDRKKICSCVSKECVVMATCGDKKCESPYENQINCEQDCGKLVVDKSCQTNADCVDDKTGCQVCINSSWLNKNPDWSQYAACNGTGTSNCECRDGQCVAL